MKKNWNADLHGFSGFSTKKCKNTDFKTDIIPNKLGKI